MAQDPSSPDHEGARTPLRAFLLYFLRLGTLELLENKEPPAVVLNEAIELARRYGSAGSPAFVNGVLDRVRASLAPAPG